jgi:hypothetical protein
MARVLRVRCTTWDQVEAFYQRKLRRGRYLAMRVPFAPAKNADLTIGLELPNQLVMAIDGTITSVADTDSGGRTAIEIHLHGMTSEVQGRLEALVADGRVEDQRVRNRPPTAPPTIAAAAAIAADEPPPVEASPEWTPLEGIAAEEFVALEAELRRLRPLPAHEVLGVAWDAGAHEVRAGWLALGHRFHPDVVARHASAALTHVAEELTIHVNRAYDRLRAALVADGRAAAIGPALHEARGWLVGFEEVGTGITAALAPEPLPTEPAARHSVRFAVVEDPLTEDRLFGDLGLPPPPVAPTEGDAFDRQARSRLAAGDATGAKEVLAAALHVYPKNRGLRALYHVATAVEALANGQLMLATSQLEAAVAHDEHCQVAVRALEEVRRGSDATAVRRLF